MSRTWDVSQPAASLEHRYLEQGWWTDDTLGSTVASSLSRLADATFTVHSKVRPWHGTISDLDRAARSFAATLSAHGIGAGDVVAMQLPNWAEAAVTFWGAALAGAVVVPIVHFYGAKEVEYILRNVQPDALVTADRFGRSEYLPLYEQLWNGHGDRPWFVVGETAASDLPAGALAFQDQLAADPVRSPTDVHPNDPAIIGFTSGTTRDPKGVIHSHRTILCETRQLHSMTDPTGPPPLVGTPVGHFMGMASGLLLPLLRDRPLHIIDVWDPSHVLAAMDEHHLSVGGAAPYFLMSLLDHPECTAEHIARMPSMGMGGSTVPLAVTERATRLGIRVFRSYGSTEHPSITTSFLDDPEAKRLRTDGHMLPGVEITFDDEGQILSRGPDRFLGYTDPELTSTVLDSEGWYSTGDIGTLDDDGYLTITDRISDVIIRGGENISAQEVEELLLQMSSLAEVAVVAAPDERFGERAAAVIRLAPGAAEPSLEDARTHLAALGLARQKWPESLHVVEDFPRTPTGKVQKFKLRSMLRDVP